MTLEKNDDKIGYLYSLKIDWLMGVYELRERYQD
jgi:hypothetical protein